MKKISLGTLGGTICMMSTAEQAGVVPRLSAQDFIQAIPELAQYADLTGEALLAVASGHLQFQDLLRVLQWCYQQVEHGAQGIVLTQGTDTLEDSAFFLDLLWDRPEPIVMTGAMRHPESISADGAANLLDAVIVASSENSWHRGVQVVMNNQIFEARWVSKTHTTNLATFQASTGHCGEIVESLAQYFHAPLKRCIFPCPKTTHYPKVALYEAVYSDAPEHFQALAQQADGMVIAGFGSGHLSDRFVPLLDQLTIPVLMSSRTRQGRVTEHTYGYVGSEIDLIRRGVYMTSWLNPNRARIVLWLILANQLDMSWLERYIQSLTY